MNKIKQIGLSVLAMLVCLLVFSVPVLALPTAESWEAYVAGDDSEYEVYGNIWFAQTFTVTPESHSVSQVRVLAYRELLPGTVTVSIKETAAGLPVGADLTSGVMDGDILTTDSGGVWYGVDLTEYSLEYGEVYAIVIRAEAGDASNALHLRYDGSAATEANGSEINSTNGGVTWAADTDDDLLFAVWGSSLIEATGAQVFSGYIEENDMLIVANYYSVYVPYYPSADPEMYMVIQLRSADGSAVLAQSVCRAWGNKPASIYLSADSAASLTLGTAYRVYIMVNDAVDPTDYYTLTSADWRGDDLSLLDSWVLSTARGMADYYETEFTSYTANGEVLNEEGGVIFDIGISALSSVRPDIFQSVVHHPEYEPQTWTNAFASATTWQEQVGTTPAAALTAIGSLVGIDGKAVGAFILLALYLALAIAVVARGGEAVIAVILAIPFVLLGGWLRLIDFAIIAIVASVGVLIIVFRFWWSRT